MSHCAALWGVVVLLAGLLFFLCCQTHGLDTNTTHLNDGYLSHLDKAYRLLAGIAPDNAGGVGSWNEVDAVSQAFAQGRSSGQVVLECVDPTQQNGYRAGTGLI